MTRSEIRESVFQILFRCEFNTPDEMPEQVSLYLSGDAKELPGKLRDEDREYIIKKSLDIVNKLAEIDALINEKATGWTVERMGKVDVTIIRLSVYEIVFEEDIPTGVSINEAVELAKKYGRDESGAFVNGVLAKFGK